RGVNREFELMWGKTLELFALFVLEMMGGGYGIEYDGMVATEVWGRLERKKIGGVFRGGEIKGR
uniref:hypothetical protein n=1 Tax=Bacillus licheniformis TaxID=1402 RepID=UPI001C92D027